MSSAEQKPVVTPEEAVTKMSAMIQAAAEKTKVAIAEAQASHEKQQRRSELLHFTAMALSGISDITETPEQIAARAVRIGLATVEEFEAAVERIEEKS